MQATDVERTLQTALQVSGLSSEQRPRLLTDNGSAYVSQYLKGFLKEQGLEHVRSAPFHPMTQGKIERYHRSMKNVLLLEHYFSPDELTRKIEEWVNYYNHQRYHESLNNLTPADIYYGRQQQKLEKRKKIKNMTMLSRRKSGTPQRLYLSAHFNRLNSLFLASGFCPLSLDDIQFTDWTLIITSTWLRLLGLKTVISPLYRMTMII